MIQKNSQDLNSGLILETILLFLKTLQITDFHKCLSFIIYLIYNPSKLT